MGSSQGEQPVDDGVAFPRMGQKFLEKALLSFKRAMGRANPRCREKMIRNLVINEMVRGHAQRNWITEQLGYEIPLSLVLSPTMRCPLRCYGCYSAEYARNSDLDYETFDRTLTEAKSLGSYFMVVSGGEPLIYDGIFDLLKKHDDIWFQVYTSGVTLNDKTVDKLAELGNAMPCDNYLRPCMIIDSPEVLKDVIEEARPYETCRGGAFRLISDLRPNLLSYASRWKALSDPVWQEKFAVLYRKPILDAHALSESHAREHPEAHEAPARVSAAGG